MQSYFFSDIILTYTLDIGSSGTDFSLADSVSIRFVKIYLNMMNSEKFQFLRIFFNFNFFNKTSGTTRRVVLRDLI